MNGAVPPLIILILVFPSLPPKHEVFGIVAILIIESGLLIVNDSDILHPFTSETDTEYVPAFNDVK